MAPALALDGVHKLALRSYQEETLAASEAAEARGCRRQLWVMATGLGKTVCFVALAAKRGDRTLIIAHRDELIGQAAAKARLWWPDADIGIVKGPRNDFGAQDVVVASVQSLSPARLARLGRFGLVVVDEAHHCRAKSYGRALEAVGWGKPGGPLGVGVTATPGRTDGKGLGELFDEIVVNYPIVWGMRAGYLVDLRCKEVKLTNLRLEGVTMSRGDYSDGDLSRALADAQAPWHIVKAWKELAAGRLTASFHPTIEAAQSQADECMAQGVRAINVSGVDLDTRRRALADLAAGRIQWVTNAMVLTEGWDFPALSCIVQARPTKSEALFTQVVGRGLRPFPGKSECLVLDVVGATEKVKLCSVPTLLDVPKRAMTSRSALQALEAKDKAEAKKPSKPGPRTTGDVVTRDVDLFKEVAKQGRVAWGRLRNGFAASVDKESVVLLDLGDGTWGVKTVSQDGTERELLRGVPLTVAQGVAEEHVRRHGAKGLVDKMAKWRKDAPSEAQMKFAQKLHLAIPEGTTKGALAEMIDARMAELRLSRSRRRGLK